MIRRNGKREVNIPQGNYFREHLQYGKILQWLIRNPQTSKFTGVLRTYFVQLIGHFTWTLKNSSKIQFSACFKTKPVKDSEDHWCNIDNDTVELFMGSFVAKKKTAEFWPKKTRFPSYLHHYLDVQPFQQHRILKKKKKGTRFNK